jgi:hypothetical protein
MAVTEPLPSLARFLTSTALWCAGTGLFLFIGLTFLRGEMPLFSRVLYAAVVPIVMLVLAIGFAVIVKVTSSRK